MIVALAALVSIPFIAGQWSLPPAEGGGGNACDVRFNPLHCGAVVASRRTVLERCPAGSVSIPFIAGQWSLRRPAPDAGAANAVFQSPSLRGSGRFKKEIEARKEAEEVSIPFIAGQWSLRMDMFNGRSDDVEFQSPSLRGSGRFSKTTRT